MFNLAYLYMCLFIGVYLYHYWTDTPFPEYLRSLNTWACWALLLWGAFLVIRVIVDCLRLSAANQMSAENVRDGILLALMHFLPTLLIAVFMLREGFVER